jgi:hypothetical protein
MYHECESTKRGKKTFKNIRLLFDYLSPETGQRRKTLVKLSFTPHLARIKRFSLAFDIRVGSKKLYNGS